MTSSSDANEQPIRKIRHQLAMTQAEFAALCGVTPRTVAAAEEGTTIKVPRKILATLGEVGYDTEVIERAHAEFLAARRRQLLQGVKERRGKNS